MLTAADEDERSETRPRRAVENRSRTSIAKRVVLVVLASTAAALLVACAALLYYDSRVYHRAVIADATTQAQIIGQASAAALLFDDAKAARDNLALLKSKPAIVAGALYNARGALFATYSAAATPESFPKISESDGTRVDGGHVILFRRIIENNEVLGSVYLKAEYRLTEHVLNYLAIIGTVLVAGLLVAFGIAAWLQSTISTPVLAMRDIAREVVEKRDFSLRATNTTNDEIGYLADAFNDMLSEIQRRAEALERSNATLARAEEDLKKLNAELEQRIADRTTQLEAANKELESFSYSVSHDLRAPVRAIAGFSKMLADGHAEHLDDEGKRKLGIVRSEAARMGALIDDLLAFSRLGRQSIQHGPVDMKELVLRNFETLRTQHQGAEPELRVGHLPAATGDRSLLAQVWVNLISNALKFSSKKEKPVIEVSAVSNEAEHTYFVRDNGAGFDPRFGGKLFGVFQRLHDAQEFPGTGVGLALVQRIVTRHGGRVWAEGEPGAGATFYFTLPRESADGAVRTDRNSAG